MNTNTRYKLAGWLSIAFSVLAIPMILLSVFISYAEHAGTLSALASRSATAASSVVAYGVGIFLFATQRHLFETRYGYHGVSRLLGSFIWLSWALALCSALGAISDRIELLSGFVSLPGLIAFGVLGVVVGIRLLRWDADLYGLRKPYAYASIVGGACYATILLLPLGLLVDIVGGIFAALIFFRESQRPGAEPDGLARAEAP